MFLCCQQLLKNRPFTFVLSSAHGPLGATRAQTSQLPIQLLRASTSRCSSYATRLNANASYSSLPQTLGSFQPLPLNDSRGSSLEHSSKQEIVEALALEPKDVTESVPRPPHGSTSILESSAAAQRTVVRKLGKKARVNRKWRRQNKGALRFQAHKRKETWRSRLRPLESQAISGSEEDHQGQEKAFRIHYETDTKLDTVADWHLRFEKHWGLRFRRAGKSKYDDARRGNDGLANSHQYGLEDRKRNRLIMLHNLTLYHPSAAITLLADILEDPAIKLFQRFFLESLSLIILRLFWSQRQQPTALVEKTLHTLAQTLEMNEKGPRKAHSFPYAIFAIARHLDLGQLTNLWASLSHRPDYLTYKTAMELVYLFAKFGDPNTGLAVLDTIPLVNISDLRTQYALIKLLRMDLRVRNPYDLRLKVLNRYLERGLQPSIYVQNMAILNAMEAGDTQTGWDIYNLMKENGMRPNEKTYRILLIAANDRTTVIDIYRKALEDGIDTRLPRTATRFFMAWAMTPNPDGNMDTFESLLPYYTATFDPSPLRELGMLQGSAHVPDPNSPNYTPTIEAVAIMIIHFLRHKNSYTSVDTVYRNFLRLIHERHPIVAPLAHNTATANAFLMSFGRSSLYLPTCVSIIADMTNPPKPSESQPTYQQPLAKALGKTWYNPSTDDFFVAPPDHRTWNIMLHNFFVHRRLTAAEKVLQLMRKNGIEITKVTWDTLINGYAHMQDSQRVVRTLDEMQAAGVEHDERTIKAMGHLVNKKMLLEYLEKNGKDVQREWTDSEEEYREDMEEALDGEVDQWGREGHEQKGSTAGEKLYREDGDEAMDGGADQLR